MPFRPSVGSIIEVNAVTLKFLEHPSAIGMTYGQTGRKATVYQVQDTEGYKHALKVFTRIFRLPQNARGARQLEDYAALPGLSVCSRLVVTPESHPDLVKQHPDLIYAVLMPWVDGETWQEYVMGSRKISEEQSRQLGLSFSSILSEMEKVGLSHCDLSGANVLIQTGKDGLTVSLVDVEDMYSPSMERPSALPAGTPGFAHKEVTKGIWSATADRFSGAVLLAEMLGWCDDRVRRIACGETFFDPGEMQASTERYQVLLHAIRDHWGDRVGELYSRAWYAETLDECPALQDWCKTIHAGREPSLEELREEIVGLIEKGKWEEVIPVCDSALNLYGNQVDVWNWKTRAVKIIQLDGEFQEMWARAMLNGLSNEWQASIGTLKTLIYHDQNRAGYRQQIDYAERELEAALVLDQVEQCISKGLWRDAQSLLSHTQTHSPRFAPLKADIELHVQKEIEAQLQRNMAVQAIAADDWERAIVACQKALALGYNPNEIQPLLDQAYHGQVQSQRIEQGLDLVNQLMSVQKWEEALISADQLMQEFPDERIIQGLRQAVQQKIDMTGQLALARDLLSQQDYHGALALLKVIPFGFFDAAELELTARANLSWQDQLETARQSSDTKLVLSLIDHAPAGFVDTNGLRQWAQHEQQLQHRIQATYAGYLLSEAEQLLLILPDQHPERQKLADWLQTQYSLLAAIDKAKLGYDHEQVQRLLDQLPSMCPKRAELEQWVDAQVGLQAELNTLKQRYDGASLLALASGLPPDYPARDSLIDWAEAVCAVHQQLDALCDQYDLDGVERLLSSLGSDDPKQSDMAAWLSQEQDRVRSFSAAEEAQDSETALRLLLSAPQSFPHRAKFLAWAEEDVKLNQEIKAVYAAYDFTAAEQLIARLPDEDRRKASLRTWFQQESERADKIATAQRAYQYEKVLSLLADADYNFPQADEIRAWAQGWIQAEDEIEQAMQVEDLPTLDLYLQQLPDDHPRSHQISKLKEEISQRKEQLLKLRSTASQAVQSGQWELAMNSCRQALIYREAGRDFAEMMASAEKGLLQSRQTRQTIQTVREVLHRGQIEEALVRCQAALNDDPLNEEARVLFLRIREQVELYAHKLDRAQNWKDSLRVWKLLQVNSQLPDRLRLSTSDPFSATVSAKVQAAHKMRQKEILKQILIGLAVGVIILVVIALVSLLLETGGNASLLYEPRWAGLLAAFHLIPM